MKVAARYGAVLVHRRETSYQTGRASLSGVDVFILVWCAPGGVPWAQQAAPTTSETQAMLDQARPGAEHAALKALEGRWTPGVTLSMAPADESPRHRHQPDDPGRPVSPVRSVDQLPHQHRHARDDDREHDELRVREAHRRVHGARARHDGHVLGHRERPPDGDVVDCHVRRDARRPWGEARDPPLRHGAADFVHASLDAVWRALTEADELRRWFPVDARVSPGVGGSIWLSWGDGAEGEAPITGGGTDGRREDIQSRRSCHGHRARASVRTRSPARLEQGAWAVRERGSEQVDSDPVRGVAGRPAISDPVARRPGCIPIVAVTNWRRLMRP